MVIIAIFPGVLPHLMHVVAGNRKMSKKPLTVLLCLLDCRPQLSRPWTTTKPNFWICMRSFVFDFLRKSSSLRSVVNHGFFGRKTVRRILSIFYTFNFRTPGEVYVAEHCLCSSWILISNRKTCIIKRSVFVFPQIMETNVCWIETISNVTWIFMDLWNDHQEFAI